MLTNLSSFTGVNYYLDENLFNEILDENINKNQ